MKSELVKLYIPADPSNYTLGRKGKRVCKITPHHCAGILTAEQIGKIFARASRNASATYGIGNDGIIACFVDEENRPWTSSSPSNDYQAITIEVSNCEVGGDWKISDAAWNSLVNLCVDICTRYDFRLVYDGTPNGSLTRHNMFTATSCPGNYLENRFEELARTVNAILDGNEAHPTPAPEQPAPTRYKIGDTVTINGIYKASNTTQKLNPARNTGTITRIVNGAHNPYLLDKGNLGWTNDDCIISDTVAAPDNRLSLDQIAQEVIDMKWDKYPKRKELLEAAGYNYTEVQNKVNEILSGKTSSKPVSTAISVGDKVKIKSSARTYATGQTIPSRIKNKTYTVMQKGNGKSLLKEIMSWVYDKDLSK